MTECFIVVKHVDGWEWDRTEEVCVVQYFGLAEEIVEYLIATDGPVLDEDGSECPVTYRILPKRCFSDIDTFVKWWEG